jgi:glycosyltransferase involved in cell wall biosynthesis
MTDVNPRFPHVGVLSAPYHSFLDRWTTPHYVSVGLAKYFRTLWLEPAVLWRKPRKRAGLLRGLREAVQDLPPGFLIDQPPAWGPKVYRPGWLNRGLRQVRLRRAAAKLREAGCDVLVVYLWHHQFEDYLASVPHAASVYHIDDEYSFRSDPPPMEPRERRVIEKAGQVFVISPGLLARKGGVNPRTDVVTEGVDFALYSRSHALPPDMAGIPRPVVGYTGVLKAQLDWNLIRRLTHDRPEWSFVFVGPTNRSVEVAAAVGELGSRPNVFFLGPKSRTEVAKYPCHFDVCIMPYAVNGYTNSIYPLKLHEYLASGRPVAASRILSLLEYDSTIGLAATLEEWDLAILRQLSPSAQEPEKIAARQAIARSHDWGILVRTVAERICRQLGPDYVRDFQALQ